MEDEKIIALYHKRDEAAISETKSKYHHSLLSVALNIIGSIEDSEECVNDTYLGAWQSMPPEKPQYLRAFLSKITRNLSLKRLRMYKAEKRGGNEAYISLDELSEIIPSEKNTEDKVEAKELSIFIDKFLRGLKEEERNIFIKRYFFIEPIKEIAESFGFSEGKVKMKLSRTREKLVIYLDNEGIL